MTAVLDRRQAVTGSVSAAIVFGLEPLDRDITPEDQEAAVHRLERSVRPWDVVVPLGASSLGVLCTALSSAREVDAVAGRLADALRAPMAVADEIHQVGVCLGATVIDPDEERRAAFLRAQTAMREMRANRVKLLGDALPQPRSQD